MKTSPRIFVVFLVVVILFLGYWVVSGLFGASDTEQENYFSVTPPSGDVPSWAEGLDDISLSENITRTLARNISSDFIARTPDGVTVESSASLLSKIDSDIIENPEQLAQYISPEALGFSSDISDEELVMIVETTSQTQEEYWGEYLVLFNNFESYADNPSTLTDALSDAVELRLYEKLDELLVVFSEISDGLVLMKVPSELVPFHKNNMRFFGDLAIIFRAIRGSGDDPLRAYLSLQYLPDVLVLWDDVGETIKTKALTSS